MASQRTIDQGEVEVITQAAKDEAWYSRHLGCFSDTQVWNTGRLGNLIGQSSVGRAESSVSGPNKPHNSDRAGGIDSSRWAGCNCGNGSSSSSSSSSNRIRKARTGLQ
ncbi:hypothetical protein N2152v2_001139 [Parachlorella kessleri]